MEKTFDFTEGYMEEVETQSFSIYDIYDKLLFTYRCQNNSFKKTLEQAVKEGKDLSCADLGHANLQDAILDNAKLRYANFNFANLNHVSLRYADLDYANFVEANLKNVNFSYSNINNAIFDNANLRGSLIEWAHCNYAKFMSADCRYIRFNKTSLISADFTDTILRGALFTDASLDSAYFRCADLEHSSFENIECINVNFNFANLNYAFFKNVNFKDVKLDTSNILGIYISTGCCNTEELNIPMSCPSDGEFIGWKKVADKNKEKLVKLLIPEDAKRSSASTTKCRCDKAKVLAITDIDGSNPIDEITNYNIIPTLYKVGEMVYPDYFDDYRWFECGHGIHFFINKNEAIAYAI